MWKEDGQQQVEVIREGGDSVIAALQRSRTQVLERRGATGIRGAQVSEG